jgi:hypothetical protein
MPAWLIANWMPLLALVLLAIIAYAVSEMFFALQYAARRLEDIRQIAARADEQLNYIREIVAHADERWR